MNHKNRIVFLLVVPLLSILLVGIVEAEKDDDFFLDCDNFDENKEEDCEHILDSGMGEEDKLAVLKTLYYEDYSYSSWEPEDYEIDTDLLMKTEEIEYDRIFFAWRLFILSVLNYSVFSILTKFSPIIKWLSVV